MDIFQNLIVDLDHEGRYLFLNAVANQLRYPNSHTHYFSCTLLYLFVEANSEAIQVKKFEMKIGPQREQFVLIEPNTLQISGTNHSCSIGTFNRESSTSMGSTYHIHRTD